MEEEGGGGDDGGSPSFGVSLSLADAFYLNRLVEKVELQVFCGFWSTHLVSSGSPAERYN